MGRDSGIEWTKHTFNPVWGCQRVSPGCEHCYAETLDKRMMKGSNWGAKGERRTFGDKYWKRLEDWNREAKLLGENHLVFVASMSDWLENRPEWIEPRKRLIQAIEKYPNLTFQLVTKRIENIFRLAPAYWFEGGFPSNVWVGCTVEDQKRANERIPLLLKVPAVVLFLSCEPLLEKVILNLSYCIGPSDQWTENWDTLTGVQYSCHLQSKALTRKINWVIGGGESGQGARKMEADWIRSLRDQCIAAGTPFFFKQWGEFGQDGKRLGKHEAGSTLDCIQHKEFPEGFVNAKP